MRYEYVLNLSDFNPRHAFVSADDLQLRAARPIDIHALAELMIEAYRGTIDYDDETLEDAIGEIQAYTAGERGGRPLLDKSQLAFVGPQLVGACLAVEWSERQSPLIAYVMTNGKWKNRGVGKQVLYRVLQTLREQNHRQVWAVITEGNVPSERLFGGMGFQRSNTT